MPEQTGNGLMRLLFAFDTYVPIFRIIRATKSQNLLLNVFNLQNKHIFIYNTIFLCKLGIKVTQTMFPDRNSSAEGAPKWGSHHANMINLTLAPDFLSVLIYLFIKNLEK